MKILTSTLIITSSLIFITCDNSKENEEKMNQMTISIDPPIADKIPDSTSIHGYTRVDNYHWMRLSDEQKLAETPDEATQKVLDYLNAEKAYADSALNHTKDFQIKLFEEIKGRIKETDSSLPYKYKGFWYYTRYEEGKDYPIHCRKQESMENEESILLDVNKMAEGFSFYAVGGRSVSSNNKILAYGVDTLSRRIYTIFFKDLETGELLKDEIPNTSGGVTWGNDNKTVFYTIKDDALRDYKVFRHTLGTDAKDDVEIFHEKDEKFGVSVWKTKSDQYIVIESGSTLSTEARVVDASSPNGEFKIFQPRERKLEYDINHYKDHWYIVTNKDEASNFKLMKTALDATEKENWEDVIPHREDVLMEGIDVFDNYLVVSERKEGITELYVREWAGGKEHYIEFPEASRLTYTIFNPEFDTDELRIGYQSMTTPVSSYSYNMKTKERELLKEQEVLGDFDKNNYVSERVYATADDGTKIPISLVYKRGLEKNGNNPLVLYGYGSYGYSMEPSFRSSRLSLLDRGFVYAIAHIRGGQEMGRYWYENGKLLKKKNTFTDFIDCGEFLVEQKFTSSDKMFAMGGSAGGLLMGAVVNMSPDLWKGIVASVPFVDVTNTMLDESIPLTVGEFDEWGNPKEKEYYDYINSYSPYDNVEAKDYPAMLVITGYHDSQVQYWEPAKWVAKLRDMKTNHNPLIFSINMDAGHGGASGRYEQLKEIALEFAFMLDQIGIHE